jgi:hypothetical protein
VAGTRSVSLTAATTSSSAAPAAMAIVEGCGPGFVCLGARPATIVGRAGADLYGVVNGKAGGTVLSLSGHTRIVLLADTQLRAGSISG